jgi:hypothetical protein
MEFSAEKFLKNHFFKKFHGIFRGKNVRKNCPRFYESVNFGQNGFIKSAPEPPSPHAHVQKDLAAAAAKSPELGCRKPVRGADMSGSRERTFVCDFPNCNKTYLKSSHLKAHYRVHTGKNIDVYG